MISSRCCTSIALLHEHRAGLASSNDESVFLINARLLADDPQLRADLGENAQSLAGKLFSVRVAAEQIVALGLGRRAEMDDSR